MIEGLGCDYVQIEMVGKGIPEHFHIHLIPRTENEHVPESEYKKYEDGEMTTLAEKIKGLIEIKPYLRTYFSSVTPKENIVLI